MRQKKAKALRRIARHICQTQGKPLNIDIEYKKMKKNYKEVKGER